MQSIMSDQPLRFQMKYDIIHRYTIICNVFFSPNSLIEIHKIIDPKFNQKVPFPLPLKPNEFHSDLNFNN